MTMLSFGDGAHLGVPCRGAVLGHVEWEGEKQVRINNQETREFLEIVRLKSSPLQGMKAQPLQSS